LLFYCCHTPTVYHYVSNADFDKFIKVNSQYGGNISPIGEMIFIVNENKKLVIYSDKIMSMKFLLELNYITELQCITNFRYCIDI